ncbi:hypothetical protein B0H17DRAFT_940465, partial [Mycena rosella]
RTNPDGTEGNIVYMHLIDPLPLQPCTPLCTSSCSRILGYFELTHTFPSLTLQADVNRYNGTNRCLLWKTFASKGLGVNAANHVNNTDIPLTANSNSALTPRLTTRLDCYIVITIIGTRMYS